MKYLKNNTSHPKTNGEYRIKRRPSFQSCDTIFWTIIRTATDYPGTCLLVWHSSEPFTPFIAILSRQPLLLVTSAPRKYFLADAYREMRPFTIRSCLPTRMVALEKTVEKSIATAGNRKIHFEKKFQTLMTLGVGKFIYVHVSRRVVLTSEEDITSTASYIMLVPRVPDPCENFTIWDSAFVLLEVGIRTVISNERSIGTPVLNNIPRASTGSSAAMKEQRLR